MACKEQDVTALSAARIQVQEGTLPGDAPGGVKKTCHEKNGEYIRAVQSLLSERV